MLYVLAGLVLFFFALLMAAFGIGISELIKENEEYDQPKSYHLKHLDQINSGVHK